MGGGGTVACDDPFVVGAIAADAPPAIAKDTPAAPQTGKVASARLRFEACFARAIVGPPAFPGDCSDAHSRTAQSDTRVRYRDYQNLGQPDLIQIREVENSDITVAWRLKFASGIAARPAGGYVDRVEPTVRTSWPPYAALSTGCISGDVHLHVAAGRGLDLREGAAAQLRTCRHLFAGPRAQPAAPVRPPASGYLARRLQPAPGPLALLAFGPIVALVARRRIDHARDVAARPQHEPRVAGHQLRGLVGGLPRDNVILATGQHIAGRVDGRKIDLDATLRRLTGRPELVVHVRVAHVPAVHGAGQIRAVGIPVQDVERIRLAPFQIVADHVRPDQVVSAQRVEHEGQLATRKDAARADRVLACRQARLVDQQADIARVREIQHGGEKRQALDLVLVARRHDRRGTTKQRAADTEA